MSLRIRHLIAVAALAALPVAAQGQGGGVATARKIPAGVYAVVPDAGANTGGLDISAFAIRFVGDSIMVTENNGAMMSRARIQYEGEHLTWTDLEGELMCPGTAKYKMLLDDEGKELRLVPVADGCPERLAIIAQVRFVRRG